MSALRGRFVYRAGWADVGSPSWSWRKRVGFGWVYVGPYVIGSVARWDRSGEPRMPKGWGR